MSEELKCPVCGSMNYAIEHSDTTLVNTIPLKNGQMTEDDINIQTAHCACLECDAKFDICTRNGVNWIKQIYPYVTDSANHEPKSNIAKSAAASEYDLPGKSNIVNGASADEGNISIGYVKSASPYKCKQHKYLTVTDSSAVIQQEKVDQLVINCNKITLKDNGIEIALDRNMNYSGFKKIIINGVTYKRVEERDDRDDPTLQYFGL